MHPFRLSISFNDFGTLNINNRECIPVQIYSAELVNNLFEWPDSGKYFASSRLEFSSANFPGCINKHYHIENGEGKEV